MIYDVVIVGAGLSGIAMAMELKASGNITFRVVERASDVGGAWRDNVYPGAACDIQSHLYQYESAPNPSWSRIFARQPEILSYIKGVVDAAKLWPHIAFDHEMVRAAWDDEALLWKVTCAEGALECRCLVLAPGPLADPQLPAIPGLESFTGQLMHSARWNSEVSLAGRRVGLIGTGASGIQIVPEVAPAVSSLTVFQRTAPYVMPKLDRAYSPSEQAMFAKVPGAARAERMKYFWANEDRFVQRQMREPFLSEMEDLALRHLANEVPSGRLRDDLTPTYRIGCKRILLSSDYYRSLLRPNVTLETDGIRSVDGRKVVLTNGTSVELDVLIAASGFEASRPPIARRVFASGNRSLDEVWADGATSLSGAAVSGFPNMFFVLGPNTGLGAGSMIYMLETQAQYAREAIAYAITKGISMQPDLEVQARYSRGVSERLSKSVWLGGGCNSWYVDSSNGKVNTMWPDYMTEFRRQNGHFVPSSYALQSR